MMRQRTLAFCSLCTALSTVLLVRGVAAADDQAAEILKATGVRGGLIVHVGCGDGTLTAALRANDSYLVHGLDRDVANVEKARKYVHSRGLYGNVSVDQWDGQQLPYVDNFVNLLVSDRPVESIKEEVLRVLCPDGIAYVKQGGGWTKTVKPRPKEMDEWTHYLHDATNNPVAHDSLVGPPRHLQWVGSPRWSRHHDRMASMSSLVSTGGRMFYIMDEGSRGCLQLPAKWKLIARDAFNGTVLWKRTIPTWHTHLWPLKSGPAQLTRRLVAMDDRVYVTLGLHAPVCALDAATGKTIRTYDATRATEELICSQGVLFTLVNPSPGGEAPFMPDRSGVWNDTKRVARERPWDGKARKISAVRASTGEALWTVTSSVVPMTLAADGRCVYLHNGERIVALDRKTGKELWQSPPVSKRRNVASNFGPNLIAYDDVILFSGGDRSMTALSADTGEKLWDAKHPPSGHCSQEDLLVVGGLVWAGAIAGGRHSGIFTGRDPRTGEVKAEFGPDVKTYWFHHRCYRSKATDRYLLPSRTGIEFVDYQKQKWSIHHWVRGGCIYGIMPCNGLVYAPPHSCACYLEAKLYGFNALATKRQKSEVRVPRSALRVRMVGPRTAATPHAVGIQRPRCQQTSISRGRSSLGAGLPVWCPPRGGCSLPPSTHTRYTLSKPGPGSSCGATPGAAESIPPRRSGRAAPSSGARTVGYTASAPPTDSSRGVFVRPRRTDASWLSSSWSRCGRCTAAFSSRTA